MTAASTLRVAAAQVTAVSGDLVGNVATAARWVAAAADQGAQLVVFPEAFLTGYDEGAFAGPLPAAEDLDGPWLQPLREAVARAGVVVAVSTPLRRDSGTTMSMLVIRGDGTVTAPYDKQHLDADERPWFTPGDRGAQVAVAGVRLGLSICYDSSFPEHARAAADAGAIGYLSSSAFFPGSAHRRDLAVPARALDNGMYVILAAATGRCGTQRCIGGSAIFDPEGRTLVQLGEKEGLAIAELDPAVVAATRSRLRMHADRVAVGAAE